MLHGHAVECGSNIVYTFLFNFSERVRQIQEKLEEFIQALNHEK